MTDNLHAEISIQANKAISALQQFYEKLNKKILFPEQENGVYFLVKYKKPPLNRKFYKKFIKLPCSDRNSVNTSVCLILPDIDRSDEAKHDPDVSSQSRQWVEVLTKDGISKADYAQVLTFTQLTREYSQPSDKAKLANSYDIFLVDNKLLLKAYSFLGSDFRRTDKIPLPLDLSSPKRIAQSLEDAYRTVVLPLEPYIDCFLIRIGHLHQKLEQLSKNFDEVLRNVLVHCPGGPENLRSCYIQTKSTEHSLPVYVDFGSANDIKFDDIKQEGLSYYEEIDELSTLPEGLFAKVRSDGNVTVVSDKNEEVFYPTEKDEWEAKDDIKPLSKKAINRIVKAKARKRSTGKKLLSKN